MKNLTRMVLAAPLALALAACGGNDDAAEAGNDYGAAETAAPAELATVGADARSNVAYDGTYTKTMADGTTRSITLNSADESFSMVTGDGEPVTGNFNWYSDNSRILIKNGEDTMVFGVADGVIYEMADADADVSTADAANAYTRG